VGEGTGRGRRPRAREKKIEPFPGLSRTLIRNFPGPFQSPRIKTLPSPPDPCPLSFPSLRSRTL